MSNIDISRGNDVPENVLFVYLNDRQTDIYALDTMESLKYRIAFNNKNTKGEPRPTLPNLILLEEKVAEEKEEKSVPVMTAGCKAIHIKHPELERENPLAGRRFRVVDFASIAQIRITSAALDSKKQKQYATEIIKQFNLD